MPFALPFETYYKKLLACYTGKAIGGTLGMPFEGKTDTSRITYYDPVPTAMVGNDDIDLQVVWVDCLRRNGFPVNRKHLADSWKHVHFGPDEYAVTIYNTRNGLSAPLSGWHTNKFHAGMGAAIRSELWAALAPGAPALAVSLAREDACVDHYGDGVDACLFLTAVESAAYVQDNLDTLVDIGLSLISAESRLAHGLQDTRQWWKQSQNWQSVRQQILDKYGVPNWTDVTINLCFILLAWLARKNNFGKSICLAVNMGYDTDCTAATLGSILAILRPESIDDRWTLPLGNRIVLSPQIVGIRTVDTIEEFCRQITRLAKAAGEYYQSPTRIIDFPENLEHRYQMAEAWTKKPQAVMLREGYNQRESLLCLSPVIFNLTYPDSVALIPHRWASFSANVANPTAQAIHLDICLQTPDGFQLDQTVFHMDLEAYEEQSFTFSILFLREVKKAFEMLNFIITANGLRYILKAGLLTAYPWIQKSGTYDREACPSHELLNGAQFHPATAFAQPVMEGSYFYAIEVKSNMSQQVAFTCSGTRPLRMWLNETLLQHYNGNFYVPATHRGPSVLGTLKSGWNRIVIHVENGRAGEWFFAIGNPVDWIWLNNLEWRIPADVSLCDNGLFPDPDNEQKG